MPHRPPILKDLIIIAPLERLIPKEMHRRVLHPTDVLLGLDVSQAVGLVPAGGENVEGDLAADGEGQSEAAEFLLDGLDEVGADVVLLVVFFVVVALVVAGVAADGGDVDHAVPKVVLR